MPAIIPFKVLDEAVSEIFLSLHSGPSPAAPGSNGDIVGKARTAPRAVGGKSSPRDTTQVLSLQTLVYVR